MTDAAAGLSARVIERVADVPSAAWDALAHHDNPFVSHAFLHLLERSKSVSARAGWLPRHIVVEDRAQLVGAMPLYLRGESTGEYIFDWGWAEAAPRFGVNYYPKLTCAVPFTPATGPRLLTLPSRAESEVSAVRALLVQTARELMMKERASSLHVLYCRDDEAALLDRAGLMRRKSAQFHWRNDGYADFEDFLSRFSHEERKQVRRERRRVSESGLSIRIMTAREVPAPLWPRIHELYASIYDRKWGRPYLTRAFFDGIPELLPDAGVFALAFSGDALVAMTMSFERGAHLYGRSWGTAVDVPGLHFELCYYALLERAIARRFSLVEAGAQGEHKIKRGFLPVLTHSAHLIAEPRFSAAIARHIAGEARHIEAEFEDAAAHGPFKAGAAPQRSLVAGVDDL